MFVLNNRSYTEKKNLKINHIYMKDIEYTPPTSVYKVNSLGDL